MAGSSAVGRKVLLYFAWSRPQETGAPLAVIDNRFPALFESRRMLNPRYEALSDPQRFDQGIGGFLDFIQRQNFVAFVELARARCGSTVAEAERGGDDGAQRPLDDDLLGSADTVIVISFDSLRTAQTASAQEVTAVQRFLADPDHLLFVCPHHDIGVVPDLPHDERMALQLAEFTHHGDRTIPPQQRFGGFARSLLAGLGVPVENRFGLRPAVEADGRPAPIEAARELDRLHLLEGIGSLNLHAHLPHLERRADAVHKLEVLARQRIDPAAPPHPFVQERGLLFDALLQSHRDVFAGTLLIGDATLWSSTAGGLDNLQRLWTNVLERERRRP